jgi:hypothetical protein
MADMGANQLSTARVLPVRLRSDHTSQDDAALNSIKVLFALMIASEVA